MARSSTNTARRGAALVEKQQLPAPRILQRRATRSAIRCYRTSKLNCLVFFAPACVEQMEKSGKIKINQDELNSLTHYQNSERVSRAVTGPGSERLVRSARSRLAKARRVASFREILGHGNRTSNRYVLSSRHWNFAAPNLSAIAWRHWGFWACLLRIPRFSRQRASGFVAGASARPSGQREFPLLLDLGLCRQSIAHQPGALGGLWMDRSFSSERMTGKPTASSTMTKFGHTKVLYWLKLGEIF